MSTPITWKNVDAPSIADASRGLALAQQGINAGFDSFNNVIKQQTAAADANWEQVKKNNTEAFMAKLYQAQGAEGFKALQASGELDRMLAANGAQIDAAAARSAMDSRLGTLQQRDLTGIQYKNAMTDSAQEADVRRIGLLKMTDPEAAKAELAAKPELRNAVQLAQDIDARQQTLKDRVWNETKQQWETAAEAQRVLTRPLEIDRLKSDLATSDAQRKKLQDDLRTAATHRDLYGAQADLARAQAAAAAIKAEDAAIDSPGRGGSGAAGSTGNKTLDRVIANNPYDKGDYSTGAGQEWLAKELRERKIPNDQIEDILYNLGKYYSEGAPIGKDAKGNIQRVPLPISAILHAVDRSTDSTLAIGGSRRGDDVVNILDQRFGAKGSWSLGGGKGTHTITDDSLKTRDDELVTNMLKIVDARNQREKALLAPGAPTNAEVARQALVRDARRNTEATLGKK